MDCEVDCEETAIHVKGFAMRNRMKCDFTSLFVSLTAEDLVVNSKSSQTPFAHW